MEFSSKWMHWGESGENAAVCFSEVKHKFPTFCVIAVESCDPSFETARKLKIKNKYNDK